MGGMNSLSRRTWLRVGILLVTLLIVGYVGAYFGTTQVRALPLPAGPTKVRTMGLNAYRVFSPLRAIETAVTGMPTACRDCQE